MSRPYFAALLTLRACWIDGVSNSSEFYLLIATRVETQVAANLRVFCYSRSGQCSRTAALFLKII
jgi:hypothetical protein